MTTVGAAVPTVVKAYSSVIIVGYYYLKHTFYGFVSEWVSGGLDLGTSNLGKTIWAHLVMQDKNMVAPIWQPT